MRRGHQARDRPAYNSKPERLEAHPKKNNWVGYIVLLVGSIGPTTTPATRTCPELEQRIRTERLRAFPVLGNGG